MLFFFRCWQAWEVFWPALLCTRQLYFRLSVKLSEATGGVELPLFRHSGSPDQLTALRKVTPTSPVTEVPLKWEGRPVLPEVSVSSFFKWFLFVLLSQFVVPPSCTANPARAESRALKVKWHFLLSPRLSYGGYMSKAESGRGQVAVLAGRTWSCESPPSSHCFFFFFFLLPPPPFVRFVATPLYYEMRRQHQLAGVKCVGSPFFFNQFFKCPEPSGCRRRTQFCTCLNLRWNLKSLRCRGEG